MAESTPTRSARTSGRVAPAFLSEGGAMGQAMRSFNWKSTSLGAISRWPEHLRTAVRITLLSPHPSSLLWGDERIMLYNDAFSALLGARHPGALGRGAADVWADSWDEIGPHLAEPSKGADEIALPVTVGTNGTSRAALRMFTTVPIPDADGGQAGLLVTASPAFAEPGSPDLHGAELAGADERFRSLANLTPMMMWVFGLEGCEFANRAFQTFVGQPESELLGNGWQKYLHPLDAADYIASYVKAMEERRPFEGLARLRRADGEWRWFRADGVPRLRPDGALLGYVGCSIDVTEMKESESALREIDRRKDAFLATLAHELRNPLQPLRHGLQIMQLAEHDATAVAQARSMMKRQLQHMVRLIDDLLDVSRLTLGKVQMKREMLELGQLVRSAAESTRPAIEEQEQRLQLFLTTAPIWIDGDATRITQVLANLLNNAGKFTARGGRITIAVEREMDDAVIRVSDTGVGIPQAMLSKVFDIFTQADEVSGGQAEGLGVGLSISRQLVELHGGSIEGHSRGRGQGSEFVVRLPTVEPPSHAAGSAVESQSENQVQEAPVRVLVADDNVDSAVSLGEVLRMLGHDVRVAHDGMETIEVASVFRPDVILLDIGMPKLNGYDACRRIREETWGRAIRMVALTGWGQAEHRQRTRSAGFDHHLVKPVELSDLQAVIGRQPGP